MGPINLESIRQILDLLAEAERSVSALYRLFAGRAPSDPAFWENLAAQEQEHSDKIKTLWSIVEQRPEKFSLGRMFSPAAVQTFISGVRANVERVQSGELLPERFVPVALSLETSLLENRFYELFQSSDLEFNQLRNGIIAETQAHQRALRSKKS